MDPLGLMLDGVVAQVDGGDYIAVLGRTFERLGKKRRFFILCYPVRYPSASSLCVSATGSTLMEPRGFEPLNL
jgi:hypothetical protein